MSTAAPEPRLLAIGDLHVTHPENRRITAELAPASERDWLILAGDVSEAVEDIEWAMRTLTQRFEKVLWTPGNHDLWTTPDDAGQLRGVARYEHLVELCRRYGVSTPEDPYPIWDGADGPIAIASLFLLYDYSFGANIAPSKEESLALAYRAGVVCSDEYLLHPDPFPTREAWCLERLRVTESRLSERPSDMPTILINHFPLTVHPTRVLRYPEFAQWCGTDATADWHRRFGAVAVVYGHLHIPRTTWLDEVRFEEVSLGYPREWQRRPPRDPLRQIWPPSSGKS